MRTPNLGSVYYVPADVPESAESLPYYLRTELQKISAAVMALSLGHLDQTTVAPTKPRDGDVRYASGAPNWNPGSGKGVYYYNGTTWVLLG